MPDPHLIVFSHTHWDRAWYAPFEVFRHKLVEHMDELIAVLEGDPGFLHYTLDGQTSLLEDYLEVRPEQRARLEALVSSGRLEVGPWYVQPDCFIPSGESLIRNLQRGRSQGLAFGGVCTVGYLPDSFGFPSQLPTILQGFGIDSMVFSRGMVEEVESIGCEFRWQGAGTAAVTTVWMPQGYGGGCNLGYVTWWGDPRRQDFQVAHAVRRLRENITLQQRYSRTGVTVVPNGVDHCPIEANLPRAIAGAREAMPEQHPRHGTLRSYIDAVHASGARLETYRGELNSAAKGVQLRGVYSARLYLKRQNHDAETLLQRWAEPMAALAQNHAGMADQRPRLRHAWKLLLQNHPHDDICGCSVDGVHRDNEARFLAVSEVAQVMRREAAIRLHQAIDFTAQDGFPLVLHNPHAFPLEGWQEVDLFLEPQDLPPGPVALRSHLGQALRVQELGRSTVNECWVRGVPFKRVRVRLLLHIGIPACGWTTAYLPSLDAPGSVASRSAASPVPPVDAADQAGDLVIGAEVIENEHYRLRFAEDGTFDLTARQLGRSWNGLHAYEDQADRGDEYDFCPLPGKVPGARTVTPARIAISRQGPELVARIEVHVRLPARLSEDRTHRSPELVELRLTTTVRLRSRDRRIDIRTSCLHNVRDHRLRLLFPTGLAGDRHSAEEAFTVVDRPDHVAGGPTWSSQPTPTCHQRSFLSLDDGRHGLTLINRGLDEYEVLPDRTIALTLVRAVDRLSRSDLTTRAGASGPDLETPDAQCLREHVWDYALVAHRGSWQEAGSWRDAHAFIAPAWAFRGDEHLETDSRRFDDPALSAAITFSPAPRGGTLPHHASVISFGHEGIVLSALKPAESGSGMIARFYALGAGTIATTIRFGLPLGHVHLVDLAERPLRELALHDGAVRLELVAGDLVTLLLA